MKRVIAILSLVVLPVMIFAQTSGKLSGVVTSADGTPLAGANVVLNGTTMGAATDEDGQYFILDVAVGTYAVRADYIGYKTHTVNNIRVSVGLTTGLDFTLDVAAVEGEEVIVTAERPLINLNATNTTAILDAETIQALPLRDIADAVGLQAGVVTEDGNAHVRGGRDGDNAYYVDGVLLRNSWTGGNLTNGISQRSVGEVSVQQGGLGAEYGNANGGVMLVTTETGGSKWTGSAEFVTDLGATEAGTDQDKLYSYGNQVLNFNIGGPISDNIRFFLSVENEKNADADPSWGSIPFADVDEYTNGLTSSDSAAIWIDGDPTAGLNDDYIYFEEFVRNNKSLPADLLWAYQRGLEDPDFEIPAEWFDTTYVAASNYEQRYGPAKNAEDSRLRLGGNVVFDFKPFRFKVGGQMYNYEQNLYQDIDQLLNWENPGKNEADFLMGYINATWGINTKSFLKMTGSYTDYNTSQFNRYHKDDFEAYGMRTTEFGDPNYYYRGHGLDALSIPGLVDFNGYGEQYNNYLDRNETKMGLRLDYVNQLGVHEIRTGLEYYNTEISFYQSTQMSEIYQNLARVDVNFNGVVDASEVPGDIDDWRFAVYRNAYVDNLGYNIYGDEASSYNEDDHGLAPGNPINMRFYLADKLEYKDIVMNLGLAYESFNPNASAPDSDGDGFGDTDGFNNIDHTTDGRIDRSGTADESFKWEEIETHTSWLPRIGFAFPVSDKTVFRAQYGNYMQNVPLQFLYLTDSQLSANLTQGNATVSENPTLKPERTTSYEVGFSQQLGESAAIDIAGFYKEVRDYILQVNRYNATRDGSDFVWNQYVNGDYGVTTGFQMNVRMRRTKGFLADVNYTMMWARGTGSDPASNFDISWTGDDINDYPTIINRLDFDQRHTGSVMLDYRAPQRDGLLANFGTNAVLTFGSGQAYTPYSNQSFVFGRTWNVPIAAINSADMPWTTRLDLRIDKGFTFGGKYLNLYVLVLNALNSELVNNVYGTTGQAGEDGWLESPAGQVWLNGAAENYPNVDSRSLYNARLGTNARWGIPRTVRFGIQVNI
jgi:outer membrane receptor protein involved in Fe transport